MAKIKFKNLAHSSDETVKGSVGGKRHTAIFDAWSESYGANVADIAVDAASRCDVEVEEIHVSAYVKGVKETAPSLFKAMPAIVKSESKRGRSPAQPVSESSLLAILKARQESADNADTDESDDES